MKNTVFLKIAIIITFSIIILPYNKIALPNLMVILYSTFESFISFFAEKITVKDLIYPINSILSFLSLIMFLSKKKGVIIFSIILQINWLTFIYKYSFLKHLYFTIPAIIYLILSIILIYNLFSKKHTIK